MVSEWAARTVLRYWRLRRQGTQLVNRLRIRRRQLSITLAGHALVLGLGFVLVVPVVTVRAPATPALAAPHTAYALWTTPPKPRNVPLREALKASALEERPAPEVIVPVAPPAPVPRPAAPAFIPPPPGSGGDGLAAIYAVFGNSPGLSWALRVANCESHYNPLAVNRSSGASGLFQFMPSTWNANFPGQNIWDPYAQARGALVFYNAGRQSAWTCK